MCKEAAVRVLIQVLFIFIISSGEMASNEQYDLIWSRHRQLLS